ncbi:MAG: hypothetical protein R6U98_15490 [Pirellulaceae bacterium]
MSNHTPAIRASRSGGELAQAIAQFFAQVAGSRQGGGLFGERRDDFLSDLCSRAEKVVDSANLARLAVEGKPEFTVIHKGLRYWFPSEEKRKKFLADPGKYEVSATSDQPSMGGSGSRKPDGSGSRKPDGSGSGSR